MGADLLRFVGHDYRVPAEFSAGQRWLPGPITQTVFPGTAGNDHFTGANSDDIFNMADGGRDVVKGKGGDDVFNFGASLTADDKIDGGADSGNPFIGDRDALFLDGDYSAGVVFGATTMVGVETMHLQAGHSYSFTIDDATVAAADFLTIRLDGTWGAGDNLTFDASAETDGFIRFFGGAGVDTLTGGALIDEFTFDDASLSATDRIDGGSGGFDTLTLNGDYSGGLILASDTIRNIDVIYFGGGQDYGLAIDDGNVAAGETLNVSGAFLGVGDILVFDGSAERDGHLNVYGGDDVDVLTGGRRRDYLQGNDGADVLTGGRGHDTIGYAGAGESSGVACDRVVGFDFDHADKFDMWFDVTGTDTAVESGTLSTATFDADLKHALNGAFFADHAVLFTPDTGDFAGSTLLVIDADSKDGYKAGIDVVVLLFDTVNIASLDAADFI